MAVVHWQIGTDEGRGVVGSRAARSKDLEGALGECRQYSRYRGIREAWLREYGPGGLGPRLATFVKGKLKEDGNG